MNAPARHEHTDRALRKERFARSNSYDPKWILDNQMDLNPLWLTEWVCEKTPLAPGMRLLDLDCGKGLSSIFLVKECAGSCGCNGNKPGQESKARILL